MKSIFGTTRRSCSCLKIAYLKKKPKRKCLVHEEAMKGLNEVMTMAGNRYSWFSKSDSTNDVLVRINTLCLNKKVSLLEKMFSKIFEVLLFLFNLYHYNHCLAGPFGDSSHWGFHLCCYRPKKYCLNV